jgi:hypothetical protein
MLTDFNFLIDPGRASESGVPPRSDARHRATAGLGSLDQLGRMPFRVFSFDEDAFKKKKPESMPRRVGLQFRFHSATASGRVLPGGSALPESDSESLSAFKTRMTTHCQWQAMHRLGCRL